MGRLRQAAVRRRPSGAAPISSRYTHRVAISNSRLIALDQARVTFKWKDYRIKGRDRLKIMTLDVAEFIRRFLTRVLPSGFHRIRHYGLFAGPMRPANILRLRDLIAASAEDRQPFRNTGAPGGHATAADRDDAPALPRICPCCGGRMSVVETFARGARPRRFRRRSHRDQFVMTPDPIRTNPDHLWSTITCAGAPPFASQPNAAPSIATVRVATAASAAALSSPSALADLDQRAKTVRPSRSPSRQIPKSP